MTTAQDELRGRVAVITGAGSGVGRATAHVLAAEGVDCILVGRTAERLAETAQLVINGGARAAIAAGDVADEADVERATQLAETEFGGVDILVHAAGVGIYGPVETYALADWNQTLATNLTGAFLLSRAVLGSMRARGGGAIIAIASGAGRQGYPTLAAYSASKFGLIGFMQSLAGEAGEDRIKVSTILPGSILTDFGPGSAETKRASRDGKKFLDAEDVARAVLFLLRQPSHAWTQELNLWPF